MDAQMVNSRNQIENIANINNPWVMVFMQV